MNGLRIVLATLWIMLFMVACPDHHTENVDLGITDESSSFRIDSNGDRIREYSWFSNRDGHLNPGEKGTFASFRFVNATNKDILNPTGTLSTESPYITFEKESQLSFSLGSVCEKESICSIWNDSFSTDHEPPIFMISPDTPPNTSVVFDFLIKDETGTEYQFSVEKMIIRADVDLQISRVHMSDGGNYDDRLSPGESITFSKFELESNLRMLTNAVGIVSSDYPHITFNTQDRSFVVNTHCSIKFTIDPDAQPNDMVLFDLVITDRFGQIHNLEHKVRLFSSKGSLSLASDSYYKHPFTSDRVLKPGDTVTFDRIFFENSSDVHILNPTGSISTESPYIQFDPDDDLSFTVRGGHLHETPVCEKNDGCAIWSTRFSSHDDPPTFTISPDTPSNTPITFDFNIEDKYGNLYKVQIDDIIR